MGMWVLPLLVASTGMTMVLLPMEVQSGSLPLREISDGDNVREKEEKVKEEIKDHPGGKDDVKKVLEMVKTKLIENIDEEEEKEKAKKKEEAKPKEVVKEDWERMMTTLKRKEDDEEGEERKKDDLKGEGAKQGKKRKKKVWDPVSDPKNRPITSVVWTREKEPKLGATGTEGGGGGGANGDKANGRPIAFRKEHMLVLLHVALDQTQFPQFFFLVFRDLVVEKTGQRIFSRFMERVRHQERFGHQVQHRRGGGEELGCDHAIRIESARWSITFVVFSL